jgi:hypothetical protein
MLYLLFERENIQLCKKNQKSIDFFIYFKDSFKKK